MRKDVNRVVRECQICLVNKHETSMVDGLLQSLPIAQQPWLDISMNFIDCLLLSNKLSVVFTVVDRFTKFSFSHLYITVQVAEVFFFNEVFKLHGLPKTIVSDRDTVLQVPFGENCSTCRSKLTFNSAYLPKLDGQSKAVNKAIETYLSCLYRSQA